MLKRLKSALCIVAALSLISCSKSAPRTYEQIDEAIDQLQAYTDFVCGEHGYHEGSAYYEGDYSRVSCSVTVHDGQQPPKGALTGMDCRYENGGKFCYGSSATCVVPAYRPHDVYFCMAVDVRLTQIESVMLRRFVDATR